MSFAADVMVYGIEFFHIFSVSGAVGSKQSLLRNLEMRIIREWGIGGWC
jgi:hypothetical protein